MTTMSITSTLTITTTIITIANTITIEIANALTVAMTAATAAATVVSHLSISLLLCIFCNRINGGATLLSARFCLCFRVSHLLMRVTRRPRRHSLEPRRPSRGAERPRWRATAALPKRPAATCPGATSAPANGASGARASKASGGLKHSKARRATQVKSAAPLHADPKAGNMTQKNACACWVSNPVACVKCPAQVRRTSLPGANSSWNRSGTMCAGETKPESGVGAWAPQSAAGRGLAQGHKVDPRTWCAHPTPSGLSGTRAACSLLCLGDRGKYVPRFWRWGAYIRR